VGWSRRTRDRNGLFRGFVEEEEELKKCEDMERMGRIRRRTWNGSEEEESGGGGDMRREKPWDIRARD